MHSQIGLLFWVENMHKGEIFLAPPPVVLEDDEFQEEPMYGTQILMIYDKTLSCAG